MNTTPQLTRAQFKARDKLTFDIIEAAIGMGDANIGPALVASLMDASIDIPTLRLLSRELDRLADQRERIAADEAADAARQVAAEEIAEEIAAEESADEARQIAAEDAADEARADAEELEASRRQAAEDDGLLP